MTDPRRERKKRRPVDLYHLVRRFLREARQAHGGVLLGSIDVAALIGPPPGTDPNVFSRHVSTSLQPQDPGNIPRDPSTGLSPYVEPSIFTRSTAPSPYALSPNAVSPTGIATNAAAVGLYTVAAAGGDDMFGAGQVVDSRFYTQTPPAPVSATFVATDSGVLTVTFDRDLDESSTLLAADMAVRSGGSIWSTASNAVVSGNQIVMGDFATGFGGVGEWCSYTRGNSTLRGANGVTVEDWSQFPLS